MTAAATTTSDQWNAWRQALRGQPPELTVGRAESGFYRKRNRAGQFMPIAIWRNDSGALFCKIGIEGGQPVADEEAFCERIFAWCWQHPVSRENYDEWLVELSTTGVGRWHDDAPPPAVDPSNLPDDPFEALKMELVAESEELQRALDQPVTDEDGATRLANWRIRFADARKRGEAMRTAEKKPHDEAAAAVQKKFLPLIGLAEQAEDRIKRELGRYAESKRAKSAAPIEKVRIASVGRTMTEATVWSAEITDYRAALAQLAEHELVKAAVTTIAQASARSKARLPIAGVVYHSTTTMR